jgi:sugar phosphate isomerase/epimerase
VTNDEVKMEKSLQAYMRCGIVHFMAFPELGGGSGPWEETVRHIALDPFFNAIEITHIEDSHVRERVKDLIGLAGLAVGYGAHPTILGQGLNINSLDADERHQACKVLKDHLDEAQYMGAETFVILSGKDPGQAQRQEAVEALVESLRTLCDYSDKKGGPKVVIEVFDSEVDKRCLLGPAALARAVGEAVAEDYSNFGLLVDLSHIPLLNESPTQALVPVKKYVAGLHIGNAVIDPECAGYGDNHPIFGTPGSANDVAEVAEFLRVLLDTGLLDGKQKPIVSFEIKPLEGQDSLVMIANAKRVLNEAWAMV